MTVKHVSLYFAIVLLMLQSFLFNEINQSCSGFIQVWIINSAKFMLLTVINDFFIDKGEQSIKKCCKKRKFKNETETFFVGFKLGCSIEWG